MWRDDVTARTRQFALHSDASALAWNRKRGNVCVKKHMVPEVRHLLPQYVVRDVNAVGEMIAAFLRL